VLSEELEELTTPKKENEAYDIQIQGSDRRHPAVILRRRHRGKGATLLTISRTTLHGRLNPLYDDYAEAIGRYLERRERRQQAQSQRADDAGGSVVIGTRWLDQALQSVVEECGR
jgi:hypothetical protein